MIKILNLKKFSIEEINLNIDKKLTKISPKVISLAINKSHSYKQGNNHTKDRSEISGSSRKLFKQKGTGNARAGNAKTGIRRGGGKAFGPKFHKVSFKLNKKTVALSKLYSLISKIESNNLYLFNEDEISVENFPKAIKSIKNKSYSFVFKSIKDSEIVKKFANYKGINFMSDKTYSVFKSLKHEGLFLSKSSDLYLKHLNEVVKWLIYYKLKNQL